MESFYFSHNYNSRSDSKVKKLLHKHGLLGYGLYWAIVEDLYNNANALQLHYESIAYELRTEENTVKSIIHDFDLFVIDGDHFYSNGVKRRLEERNEKSIKASNSAKKRWNKSKGNANAMRTQSDSNAKKEKKVKEIKEIINTNNFNEDFLKDWFAWIDYKKTNHKFIYKTIESEQIAFNHLYKISNENQSTAREIINVSIANGYKGLFELKQNQNAKPTNQQLMQDYANRWKNGMPDLDENYELIQR
jgi:uncharacterized protein YdaU (DUF1376 family)